MSWSPSAAPLHARRSSPHEISQSDPVVTTPRPTSPVSTPSATCGRRNRQAGPMAGVTPVRCPGLMPGRTSPGHRPDRSAGWWSRTGRLLTWSSSWTSRARPVARGRPHGLPRGRVGLLSTGPAAPTDCRAGRQLGSGRSSSARPQPPAQRSPPPGDDRPRGPSSGSPAPTGPGPTAGPSGSTASSPTNGAHIRPFDSSTDRAAAVGSFGIAPDDALVRSRPRPTGRRPSPVEAPGSRSPA